ncbi:unnamed protein product [Linum trigynum]|uniref:Uncharacterized protein n=1 Tax=Linum trigynum TaxID=586398 RepID=A0AAV2GKA0_9ROSI
MADKENNPNDVSDASNPHTEEDMAAEGAHPKDGIDASNPNTEDMASEGTHPNGDTSSNIEEDDFVNLLLLQTEDIMKLRFKDLDEAYDFWRDYGLATGFDVRKEEIGRDKDKVPIWRWFVYSCEGKRRKKQTA